MSARKKPDLDTVRCRPGRSRARRKPHRPNYPILYSTFNKSDFCICSSRLFWSIFIPGPSSMIFVSISNMGISHIYESETLFSDLTTNHGIPKQALEIYYPNDIPIESLYKIPTCAIFRFKKCGLFTEMGKPISTKSRSAHIWQATRAGPRDVLTGPFNKRRPGALRPPPTIADVAGQIAISLKNLKKSQTRSRTSPLTSSPTFCDYIGRPTGAAIRPLAVCNTDLEPCQHDK